MADIKKELNQIKTAIYGKDVRGSIHDGIDKINKESEESKQKASEAHDVMESIINDGFDNAALESNFEQKLDDKIGQLQPEWTQFKNDTEQNFNSVTSQLNDIENDMRLGYLYDKIYGTLSPYVKPSGFDMTIPFPILISQNGKVDYDYDVASKKTPVSKRYYVDVVNGSNTNDGSESNPFKSLQRAIRYGDADTIIVKKGVYGWSNGFGGFDDSQTKSFNLIGEEGVLIGAHRDNLTWTADTTHSKVYKTTASSVVEIVDAFNIDNIKFLKKVTSIDLVSSAKGSYYINGTDIYVRLHDDRKPDEYVLPNLANTTANITDLNVYIENVVFTNTFKHTSTNGTHSLYAKNVDFLVGTNDNALSVVGSDSILQNCRAMYASRDGFNYHHNNGIKNKAIEIDCIGAYNGRDGADQNNGSTMHDGGKITRFNGEYHHNHGPNVIDVNDGTQSLNIGVHAHSSTATSDVSNVDFRTRDDADMWLVNCVSHGSEYSTSVGSPARLYKDNSLLLSKRDSA